MSSTFRFLDLPKEIRLMIYEFVPIKTRHQKIVILHPGNPPAKVFLFMRSPPVFLLSTCRLIHQEVLPIIMAKTQEVISSKPRLVVDIRSMDGLTIVNGLMSVLIGEIGRVNYEPSYTSATHLQSFTTAANARSLHDRLQAKGCVWVSKISDEELMGLATFINRAKSAFLYHQSPLIPSPELEVGVDFQGYHMENTPNIFRRSISDFFHKVCQGCESHRVRIYPKFLRMDTMIISNLERQTAKDRVQWSLAGPFIRKEWVCFDHHVDFVDEKEFQSDWVETC